MLFNLTVPISSVKIGNMFEVFRKDHQTRLHRTRKEWKFKGKYPEMEHFVIIVRHQALQMISNQTQSPINNNSTHLYK